MKQYSIEQEKVNLLIDLLPETADSDMISNAVRLMIRGSIAVGATDDVPVITTKPISEKIQKHLANTINWVVLAVMSGEMGRERGLEVLKSLVEAGHKTKYALRQ